MFNVWLGHVLGPKILSDCALERRPPFLVANPVICINSFWGPPKYVWWASVISPLENKNKKSSFAQSQNRYIVVSYFWAGYIGYKGKGSRIMRCAIWGHIEEHIENIGNILGAWREHVRNKGKMKKILPPPTQNLKLKKSRHFECMLSLPIGCMKFRCSKTVRHHFWPWLIPPLWTWG